MSRLAQQYGDLHRILTGQNAVERRATAERLVAAALSANALTWATASAQGEDERRDDHAWGLQAQVEAGSATRAEYERAFRRARAVTAARLLSEGAGGVEDAVYEAVHALPSNADVLAIMRG